MQMDSLKCVTCHLQLSNENALKSSPIPSHSNFSSKFSYPGGHLDCHHWRSWPFVLPSSDPACKDQKGSCKNTSNPHSLLSYSLTSLRGISNIKSFRSWFKDICVHFVSQELMDSNTDYGQSLHLLKKSVKLRPKQPKMHTNHHYQNTY